MRCTKMCTASWLYSGDATSRLKFTSIDLQLFSGEKTEDATPKKKQEARKKGQVAKSVEINSAFVILAAFLALKVVGPYVYGQLTGFMRLMLADFSNSDITYNGLIVLFLKFSSVFFKAVLPVMLFILIISLAVNLFQVGFVFSLEPLMPQLGRLNPLSGFARLFSKRSLVELGKSLFKVIIIGYFIYRVLRDQVGNIPKLISADLMDTMLFVCSLIIDIAFQIGGVILVMAVLDYSYQWWEHNQSLKMSKHEVKEEFKQTEGDPQIKGKIKERQRALAMRRMMQEVPKAAAVITNPTHFAVAIKYDRSMEAPQVVAKGQDFMAERIKKIAKENNVAIVENKPLARALYSAVEIGEAIPAELYQAVAEVLAYVYRLKKRLS